MIWFAQWENKSQPYTSLRDAAEAWGLGRRHFGRRVEPGIYMIPVQGGGIVRFIRADKLHQFSKFIDEM